MPNPYDVFGPVLDYPRSLVKGVSRGFGTLAELSEIDSSDLPNYSYRKSGWGIWPESTPVYTPASGKLGSKLKRAWNEFSDQSYKNRHMDREAYYRMRQSGGQRGFASYGRVLPSAVKSGRSRFSMSQSAVNYSSLGAGSLGGNQQCRIVASNVLGM